MKKFLFLILISCFFSIPIVYGNSFRLKNISFEGLDGIKDQTVLTYLPVKEGDFITPKISDEIIDKLYKSKFFSDIELYKSENDLIVKLKQRPIIVDVDILGNKKIATKIFKEVLQREGLSAGEMFDEYVLTKIKNALYEQYFLMGYYNAKIKLNIINLENNRVKIKFKISEGVRAKLTRIDIIGNKSFDDKILISNFSLTKGWLFKVIFGSVNFDQMKLFTDLELLTLFYKNRGFAQFKINSFQINLSPNKKEVYLTINIEEGKIYKLKKIDFSGKLVLDRQELIRAVNLNIDETFSHNEILVANQRIIDLLKERGFANVKLDISTKFDDQENNVFLTFLIDPGEKTFVRYIKFLGNYKTNDEVLRRELKQVEGQIFSPIKISESKRALLTLPSKNIRHVDVNVVEVRGEENQVDLIYKVEEVRTAGLKFGIGYSLADNFMINTSFRNPNFLGTGKTLGISLDKSKATISGRISFYNPYYTKSGIGRSLYLYGNSIDTSEIKISDYTLDSFGGGVNYIFPLSDYSDYSIGASFSSDHLIVGENASSEVKTFKEKYDDLFFQIILKGGWNYNTFDRFIMPRQGFNHSCNISLALPISDQSLEYYKMNYSFELYHLLYREFILNFVFNSGFGGGYAGTDDLPFFENFHAGGFGSPVNHQGMVRGYDAASLGPIDSNRDAIGGSFLMNSSISLIFPNPLGQNVRSSFFLDGGNVYKDIEFNDMRYSLGLQLDWLTPLGVTANFAFAKPLNDKYGDSIERFDFAIGASF